MKLWRKRSIKWLCALLAALLVLGVTSVRPDSLRAAARAENGVSEDTPEETATPTPKPTPDPTKAPEPVKPPESQQTTPPTESDPPKDPETTKPTDTETTKPTETTESQETTPPPTDPDNTTVAPSASTETSPSASASAETSPSASASADTSPSASASAETSPSASASASATASADNTIDPDASDEPDATLDPNASIDPEASATIDPNATPTVDPNFVEDQSPDMVEDPGGLVLKDRNPYSGWYGVVPSDERGMPIPILYQTDYPETICIVRGIPRSVSSSGCGATSVSMVIAYLTGNTEQTPYTLFYRAVETGRYFGAGLDHDTLSWLLKQYGVKSKWISNSGDAIINALKEGKPVVAHMGKGIFTKGGHYVVLRGVTEDGKILLNDPVSPTKTHRAFPIQTLLTQARNNHAFMVCWKDPEPAAGPTLVPATFNPAATPTPDVESIPMPVETPAPHLESQGMPIAPDAIVPRPPMPAIVAAAYEAFLAPPTKEPATPEPTSVATPVPTPEPTEVAMPEPTVVRQAAEPTPLPSIILAAHGLLPPEQIADAVREPWPTIEVVVDATLEPKA